MRGTDLELPSWHREIHLLEHFCKAHSLIDSRNRVCKIGYHAAVPELIYAVVLNLGVNFLHAVKRGCVQPITPMLIMLPVFTTECF